MMIFFVTFYFLVIAFFQYRSVKNIVSRLEELEIKYCVWRLSAGDTEGAIVKKGRDYPWSIEFDKGSVCKQSKQPDCKSGPNGS